LIHNNFFEPVTCASDHACDVVIKTSGLAVNPGGPERQQSVPVNMAAISNRPS